MQCIIYLDAIIYRHGGEESLPKMMDIGKITQGTIEEQMFHNRRTLQEITNLREIDTYDQVILL